MPRWPKHNPNFWETAPFFRLLLPLVAGILVYDLRPPAPSVVPVWLAGLCLFIVLAAGFKVWNKTIIAVSSFTLLALCGWCTSWLYDVRNDPHWFGRYSAAGACRAVIAAPPAEKDHTWKLAVDVITVIDSTIIHNTKGAATVYLQKEGSPMLYHTGDTVLLANNWQPLSNAGNPFEFDHAQYCRHTNIYRQQYCKAAQVRLYALGDKQQISLVSKLHNYCMDALERYIPHPATMGLIQAMLIGDEVNLDPELRRSFADTGIVHVIAISGGNVMMFFVLIGWLMLWLKHRKYRWVQYVIALPLVWIYVIMAGASPSAIRAAVMFSVLALGFVMDKDNNALNQLLATAFILLCAQPGWLYSLGFQLSFVAVLSLILFYSPIHRLYRPALRSKFGQWLVKNIWATICGSFAAEVLVAPLSIYYFHNFPAMFLMANVLAAIFMFAVLILGILTVVASFITPVSTVIGQLDIWVVKCFSGIVNTLQQLSPASFHYLQLSTVQLGCIYIVIAGLGILLLLNRKKGAFISLAATIVLLLSLIADKYHSLQQDRLIVYNTPDKPHVERITGDRFTILSPDTSNTQNISYTTTPAHIALQAWHQHKATNQRLFLVNGKRVLILDTPATAGHFPVDYLILNYHAAPGVAMLQTIYTPRAIILGNNYSYKERQQWNKVSAAQLYKVGDNGAFTIEQ